MSQSDKGALESQYDLLGSNERTRGITIIVCERDSAGSGPGVRRVVELPFGAKRLLVSGGSSNEGGRILDKNGCYDGKGGR